MGTFLGKTLEMQETREMAPPCVCLFLCLAMLCSMWDLSSRPGIEPTPPAVKAQILNHWTAKEVLVQPFGFRDESLKCGSEEK